ncbi:lipoate--protein ligase [Carboxylicivirga sediminis]|uniref:lipoate--protein ligase n=1 Tax=Carboxylicivirga sediminis TaxID=2006564 RepID=A0A941IYS1_9BACT|nr:lipoate--protein ligase [Carboxylicivirga sediminis]MBR8537285.1 lipoate--protein ligase [Carboxylicivirga sediminis]
MKGLISKTNSPSFNLATEEYLLRHTQEDVFFLYTNAPSIIVGKHQNTLAEINYEFVNKAAIPIYRRLSGGGTVYHDDNNLNFCFIKSGKKGDLVNFERYSEPILLALNELGIAATFGKRHDIQIAGKKVSGNASHVYKNRVMHHGTLLFRSDLSVLNKALKNNPLIIKDKAVKSVRSEVANISDYLNEDMNYNDFAKYIFQYLLRYYENDALFELTEEQTNQIEAISESKFSTWEWNYGYSPNFELKRLYKLENGTRIKSHITVQKGIITQSKIESTDGIIQKELNLISDTICGLQHHSSTLKNELVNINFININKSNLELINKGFFS